MLDLLILAVITFFIVRKLKSILGKESDDIYFRCYTVQQRKDVKEAERVDDESKNTSDCLEHFTQETKNNIKIIHNKIENFSPSKFQKIATKVLERVIKANNEHNKSDIKKFFSSELAESICKTFENTEISHIFLVSFKEIKIMDVSSKDNNIFDIKILFDMEQINYTTDQNSNNIIDGSKNEIINVQERWTFTRDLSKKNNTWLISNIEELN